MPHHKIPHATTQNNLTISPAQKAPKTTTCQFLSHPVVQSPPKQHQASHLISPSMLSRRQSGAKLRIRSHLTKHRELNFDPSEWLNGGY